MLFLGNAAVYFLFTASIGGPGPRYLFSYFPFLVVAVADIYTHVIQGGTSADRRWWRGVVAAQLATSVASIAIMTTVLYWRLDLDRTMAQLPTDGAAHRIVLLTTGTYLTNEADLTMNPPDLASAPTLYLANCDAASMRKIEERFAGRESFEYAYPGNLVRSSGVVQEPSASLR